MPAPCTTIRQWLASRAPSLARLTGQDARALEAIAHAWSLYAVCDPPAILHTLAAIRALMRTLQPNRRPLAREVIAWVLTDADRDRLWPLVDVDAPDDPDERGPEPLDNDPPAPPERNPSRK